MSMEAYRGELAAFVQAAFGERDQRPVFGEGRVGAPVMMIGEAPGEQEVIQGRPFVGKAGKNLDAFLAMAGIDRRELYVTNTVKIRPTRISAAGRVVNRPPTQEEIRRFLPWLLREIELVSPVCIITLGNVPLKALAGADRVIGAVHGMPMDWERRTLFPLYHPASVIYNPALKAVYEGDVQAFAAWFFKNVK